MPKAERRLFTNEEKSIILSKSKSRCAHCGRKLDIHTMTVDHIYPMDKGGLNDEYNLLALCEDCNVLKSNFVYSFDDWYKFVDEAEKEKFLLYNTYATFEYVNSSLVGYDALCFYFISDKITEMLANMHRRGVSSKKIHALQEKAYISVPLTKAYPGECEAIFEFLDKQRPYWDDKMVGYANKYELLNDIKNGEVYVLESQGKVCGVFAFKSVSECPGIDVFPQVKSIADTMGLALKYVMICAVVDRFAANLFDTVMSYFEDTLLFKGMMPLWLGILNKTYIDNRSIMSVPFEYNGKSTTLDFLPATYMKTSRFDYAETAFKEHGYTEVPEAYLDEWLGCIMKYKYSKDYADDERALELFEKYPGMKMYFKEPSYELYDVGFVTISS